MSLKVKQNGLTLQQRKFVNAYLETGNATQAAIRAGYSESTATKQSGRFLQNPHIAAEIKRKEREFEMAAFITRDFIQAELLKLYETEATTVEEKRKLLSDLGDTIGIKKQQLRIEHSTDEFTKHLDTLSDEELERLLEETVLEVKGNSL